MSAVAFLIDECVPASFLHGVHSRAPYIQVSQVGSSGMPTKRTPDSDVLIYCEEQELALISTDYRTLPTHATNHVCSGRHTWGIFILRPGIRFDMLLDDLLL